MEDGLQPLQQINVKKIQTQSLHSKLFNDDVWEQALAAKRGQRLSKLGKHNSLDGESAPLPRSRFNSSLRSRESSGEGAFGISHQRHTDQSSGVIAKYRSCNSRFMINRYSQATHATTSQKHDQRKIADLSALYTALEGKDKNRKLKPLGAPQDIARTDLSGAPSPAELAPKAAGGGGDVGGAGKKRRGPGRRRRRSQRPTRRETRSALGQLEGHSHWGTAAAAGDGGGGPGAAAAATAAAAVGPVDWVARQEELHAGAYKRFLRHQQAKKIGLEHFGRPATRQQAKTLRQRLLRDQPQGQALTALQGPGDKSEGEEEDNFDDEMKYIPPKRWDPAWGRSRWCDRCAQPCAYTKVLDAACTYCNVVVHGGCLGLGLDPHEEAEARRARGRGQWVCAGCREEIDAYNAAYLRDRASRRELEASARASTVVVAALRMLAQRRRYRAIQHVAVKMQAYLRCRIYRGKFNLYRQKMLRPIKVTVRRCTDLAVCDWDNNLSDPYVVITVHNTQTRTQKQIWRMQTRTLEDTLNPVYNETFVFSGVPAFSKIVFSVIDEDEMRDQFIGQASVSLLKSENWCKKSFKQKLKLGRCKLIPKESGGIDSPLDYHKATPQGHIEVEISPQISPAVMCGPMMGPSLEEYAQGKQRRQKLSGLGGRGKDGGGGDDDELPYKKLWVALCDGKLYLHKHFGDCQAKVVVDAQQARLRCEDRRAPPAAAAGATVAAAAAAAGGVVVFHVHPEAQGAAPFKLVCLDRPAASRWRLALDLVQNNKHHGGGASSAAAFVLARGRRAPAPAAPPPRPPPPLPLRTTTAAAV